MDGQRRRARRRADLSQHFLRSGALADSLIANSSISERDFVVEIGAGRGTLTGKLAECCHHMVAVEVDGQLVSQLRHRFHDENRVEVVEGDFLKFRLPSHPYKVFGNIPYSRTAEIIRRLVNATVPPILADRNPESVAPVRVRPAATS